MSTYHFASLVTSGIRVSVESHFVPQQSSAQHRNFVFAYRIAIHNEGDETVRLLRRHWEIVDSSLEHRVVDGDGVVGLQPELRPGDTHTYTSGSVIRTPVGKMEGHYTMELEHNGREIQVLIPPFVLMAPYLLN